MFTQSKGPGRKRLQLPDVIQISLSWRIAFLNRLWLLNNLGFKQLFFSLLVSWPRPSRDIKELLTPWALKRHTLDCRYSLLGARLWCLVLILFLSSPSLDFPTHKQETEVNNYYLLNLLNWLWGKGPGEEGAVLDQQGHNLVSVRWLGKYTKKLCTYIGIEGLSSLSCSP